jgi:Reprolysin (M12B) family zinc metalloprotease
LFCLQLYQPIGVAVLLVGVEVWTDYDRIDVSRNSEITLNNFLDYRRNNINPEHRNDNAHLIS